MARTYRSLEKLVDEYTTIVTSSPRLPNSVIAEIVGMNKRTMESALSRARRKGLLTIRRYCVGGHGVDIAPKGVTCGYVPSLTPRKRKKKVRDAGEQGWDMALVISIVCLCLAAITIVCMFRFPEMWR